MPSKLDFRIDTLGKCAIQSPIKMSKVKGDKQVNYVSDNDKILYDLNVGANEKQREILPQGCLEKAGAREKLYFNPGHVHAGVITCGGLCPGLNNVIRAVVRTLWYRYGVKRITGIRYGYNGFLAENNIPTVVLDPDSTRDIHSQGGTVLGSSRGGNRIPDIADAIERLNLNMLFTIGGDGTCKGALQIAEELEKRNQKIAVVGIPKTIDNDFNFVEKSFGFETAVTVAVNTVQGAYIEAKNSINGVGVVKLMGRESGFIAANTTLAAGNVDFCLIPENPFDLEGENGFLSCLQQRVQNKGWAVVVVAEGAGQEHLETSNEKDASGNSKLSDIGLYLKEKISGHLKKENITGGAVRYIDPSYYIRSRPASATDSIYCLRLGAYAVHAAMAGKTKTLVTQMYNDFVHIPIRIAVSERQRVDPESDLWSSVLEATRQPWSMRNNDQVET